MAIPKVALACPNGLGFTLLLLTPPNRGVEEGVTVKGVVAEVACFTMLLLLPPNMGLAVDFCVSLVALLLLPKVNRAGDWAGELKSDVVWATLGVVRLDVVGATTAAGLTASVNANVGRLAPLVVVALVVSAVVDIGVDVAPKVKVACV